jgi:hypothetical protein
MGKTTWIALSAILLCCGATIAQEQNQVKVSGLFYMDYEYIASSRDSSKEGSHGFRYRRLYLTTDYEISDRFSGRARLEAQTSRITSGKPFVFVKDLWLKWKGALGNGHDLIFGVQSAPSFSISEKAWGYRSLARTIMDRNAIVISRDFGVQLKGKFSKDGPLGYGVMFANNSGVLGETDKSKRVYGQLSWAPTKKVKMTGGVDYAAGEIRNALNTNAFTSYDAGVVRIGAEGYYRVIDIKDVETNDKVFGISVWAVAKAGENFELIGRLDRVERDRVEGDLEETFVLVGVAFIPEKNVRFIPNIWVSNFSRSDPTVLPRLTIHADF